MPFIDAKPLNKPENIGISFGLQISSKGSKCRIVINEEAQIKIFGSNVGGEMFNVQIGAGADEGKARLVMCEDGDFEAKAGAHGSMSLTFSVWDNLPKSPRPAAPCAILELGPKVNGNHIDLTLKLPDWSKPNGPGGKNDDTHGMNQAARKGK